MQLSINGQQHTNSVTHSSSYNGEYSFGTLNTPHNFCPYQIQDKMAKILSSFRPEKNGCGLCGNITHLQLKSHTFTCSSSCNDAASGSPSEALAIIVIKTMVNFLLLRVKRNMYTNHSLSSSANSCPMILYPDCVDEKLVKFVDHSVKIIKYFILYRFYMPNK